MKIVTTFDDHAHTEGATAAKAGAKAIVTFEGELIGWLGGGCLRGAVLRAAQQAIQSGTPKLIRVRPKDQVNGSRDADGVELHSSNCPSKGSSEVFIEPVLPKPPLLIIGASYVAGALAEMAPPSRLRSRSSDGHPRKQYQRCAIGAGTPGRIGARVHCRGHARLGRLPALTAALATPAPYVAFVSSPKKAQSMRERLTKDGLDAASLKRLHAPAGLDIGSETPAEIAVAILAEIVSLRRGKMNPGEV